jgi:hypothetical protein
VAELKDGFGGKIANNQAEFMVLEGPMIFIAAFALTLCHPGIAFGGSDIWKATGFSKKATKARGSLGEFNQHAMYDVSYREHTSAK